MSPLVVLVTFYSQSGAAETRALSAAVGAVQERALIRLRRLSDADSTQLLANGRAHAETLERMRKEYVVPTEADVRGADAIVVAPTSSCDPASLRWSEYFELLRSLGAAGALTRKVGAIVRNRDAASVQRFEQALHAAGLTIVAPADESPTPQAATAHGRRIAAEARSLKESGIRYQDSGLGQGTGERNRR